jgi:hypothetical protein
MELTVNGAKLECAFSVWTCVLYEQEFDGADIIADVSGRITADDLKPDSDVIVDFAKIPWLKIMQAAWAMAKTADDSLPHFNEWAKGVTEIDSWEFRGVVNKAVNETFFHQAAADGEGDE